MKQDEPYILLITQARTGSTRLPNKVMLQINGEELLKIHLSRLQKSKVVNQIVVATTDDEKDNIIEEKTKKWGIESFRGSEHDVLDRFYSVANKYKPDYVVRVTSDCPLIDAALLDKIVIFTIENNLDYCSNVLLENYPDGQDIEVMTFKALSTANKMAVKQYEREHVTLYIREKGSFYGGKLFKTDNYFQENKNYSDVRLTVDETKDFEVISKIIEKLGVNKSWKQYAELYLEDKSISSLNKKIKRNEGLKK